MQFTGEIISLVVACAWTLTALLSEIGTRRIGVMNFNAWRLFTAMLLGFAVVFAMTGTVGPAYAGVQTWLWMGLSGFVGFFFGDYCLFKSYLYISSRYTQLFMTLAPAAAAFVAWLVLDEVLSPQSLLAMAVTLFGIGITVLGRGEAGKKLSFNLPLKGMLFAIGAGIGQGTGLVLSKIGMIRYEAEIPAEMLGDMQTVIPFSANLIRCIVGFLCFLAVVVWGRGGREFAGNIRDRKAMQVMLAAVLFGPFLGVAASLMAVRLTSVGIAQTLMSLSPILIILPSYWMFRQPITVRGIVGAVISVVGASMFFW